MQQTTHPEERRRARSSWARRALRLQLEQVALQYGVDPLVLTDDEGFIWASSSPGAPAADLALSVVGLRPLLDPEGFCWIQRDRSAVLLRRLELQGAPLYLAARGPQRDAWLALKHASHGVGRILAALSGVSAPRAS